MAVKSKIVLFIIILIMAGGAIFLIDIYPAKGAVGSHSRIWLTSEKLATLRARACYDGSGNIISGCTPTASWTRLKNWVDANSGFIPDADSAGYALDAQRVVNFALVYKVTQNPAYAESAIDKIFTFINSADDFGDERTTVTYAFSNNGYTARYYPTAVALVFDWCYDFLTAGEKTELVTLLDGIGDRIYDGRGAGETPGRLWAYHDSSNNYWYGYMWALSSIGYAIYSEGTNSAADFIDYVKTTMIPETVKQTNDSLLTWPLCMGNDMCDLTSNYYGHSLGGEWSEGNGYGPLNTEFLFSSIFAIKSAEGVDYSSSFNTQNEYILQLIHTTLPDMANFVKAGQTTNSSINGKCTISLLQAIEGGLNSTSSKYGAYFANHSRFSGNLGDCYGSYHKYYEYFAWANPDHETLNYETNLATTYYAEGMRILTHRSDWTANGLWLQMRFNGHFSDHTHNGQGGNFSLYKNGWLIADHSKYEDNEDRFFNVMYLPDDADTQLWWDAPVVSHRTETSAYLYYAADISPVFTHATCGSKNWRDCDVDLNQRSFFYLKDRYLLVYDRVKTDDATDVKKWQIYFDGAPTLNGATASYANGSSKVFVKTLLPTNPVTYSDNFSCENCNDYRYQVSYPASLKENTFLHVIEAVDGAPSAMAPATTVTSTNSNLIGSFVNQQFIVLFSADNTIVSEAEYAVSASGAVTHFITGLGASTNYYFSGPTLCNHLTTNSDGVLSFTSSGSGAVRISSNPIDCQVVDLIPSPYTPDEPSPAAPESCQENWVCSAWSACEGSLKIRQCLDHNNCGTAGYKPVESVSCLGGQEALERTKYLAVAPSLRAGPQVRVYDKNFRLFSQFFAYAKEMRKGVNIALGDVDGDGETEIVTGPSAGAAPHVRIFNAAGQVEKQFFAFPSAGRLGVNLTTGDVDGDGIDEIIVAPAEKGGPQVRIFKYNSSVGQYRLLGQFFAFPPSLRMGLEIASGDLNNDGQAEILATPKGYGGPQVRVFSYAAGRFSLFSQFFAYAKSYRGGLNLAVGDVDNDGMNEIVTGAGPGGGPHVRIFNATGQAEKQFFAAAISFRGGLDVATFDYNEDGGAEIITAAYTAAQPGVKAFTYNRSQSSFSEDEYFLAFSSLYREGIRVAGN